VPEFRAVLVTVPPLLADLIRHVLMSRIEASGFALSIVAEICDLTNIGERLRALDPDVVIVGPVGTVSPMDAIVLLPRARVLTLSADLTHILGPGAGEIAPFTPDTLAERLLSVLRTI